MIQFTILAGAFFLLCGHGGDRHSQQALRTLAGRSPAQKPHGQRKEREGDKSKERGRCKEKVKQKYEVRNVGEVILVFSFMFSHFLTFRPVSSSSISCL